MKDNTVLVEFQIKIKLLKVIDNQQMLQFQDREQRIANLNLLNLLITKSKLKQNLQLLNLIKINSNLKVLMFNNSAKLSKDPVILLSRAKPHLLIDLQITHLTKKTHIKITFISQNLQFLLKILRVSLRVKTLTILKRN